MSALVRPTPGQTIGPFFRYGLEYDGGSQLVPDDAPDAVRLYGVVRDGDGEPVPDALIELWQTDPSGAVPETQGSFHRDGSTFTGWGRVHTGTEGEYEFTTLTPGNGFFAAVIFARGLLDRLHTRIYLPEHGENSFLQSLPEADRRTLVATRTAEGLQHDITLQGENETVFLAFP